MVYEERVVFHHSIPYERGRRIIKSMKDCKVEGFLEGTEDIYYSTVSQGWSRWKAVEDIWLVWDLGESSQWKIQVMILIRY